MFNVEPDDLRTEDSIETFKKLIIDRFEPLGRYRIKNRMDNFVKNFKRNYGESIADFHIRWETEYRRVVEVAGEINLGRLICVRTSLCWKMIN